MAAQPHHRAAHDLPSGWGPGGGLIPIAVAVAADLGVSAQPVLMLMTVAAPSFLTPISTAANMLVGPGAYEFGDYWKLGLPVLLWFLVVSVVFALLFWPF